MKLYKIAGYAYPSHDQALVAARAMGGDERDIEVLDLVGAMFVEVVTAGLAVLSVVPLGEGIDAMDEFRAKGIAGANVRTKRVWFGERRDDVPA